MAARNGYKEIVRALLENKTNTFLNDRNVETPRDLTLNDDVKKLLKSAERRQCLNSIMKGVTIGCLMAAFQAVIAKIILQHIIVEVPMELIVLAVVTIALVVDFMVYKTSKPSTKIDETQADGVYYNSCGLEVSVI